MNPIIRRIIPSLLLAFILSGCTSAPRQETVNTHSDKFQQDRRAILAMAGEYAVDFHFAETVAMQADYELRDPYNSKATEYVQVLEDTGDRIVLQHILVIGENHRVVKHWRQDWTYENTRVVDFKGHRTWESRKLNPSKVTGTWSQSVWQVDDSPRYESIGHWRHTANQSVWTSGTTWRPLPRREWSNRDDYDVMVATNRHVITPDGWVHEQDNYKLVLRDDRKEVLARERGLNRYTKIDHYDFSAGREYWDDTHEFWAAVRNQWTDILESRQRVQLAAQVDNETLWQHLFRLADENPDPALVPQALGLYLND